MKLPKAATTEAAPEKQQDISIAIAGDRKLYFDGRATTPEQLRARCACALPRARRIG